MSSPTQPTVLVVDDEADLRQLIAESLSADGFEVAQAPDAADAIERLKNFAYDALVVDLRLPDADGMEVLDAALSRYPDILAVMVTGFGGVTEAVSAMKRGAADFLTKPIERMELLQAVHAALDKERVSRHARAEVNVILHRLATLTPREHEVFEHVISGRLNKQTAAELGAAEKTIKVHRARVMEKMQAESLADLVRLAERAGVGAAPVGV